jgi:hypothetical protein
MEVVVGGASSVAVTDGGDAAVFRNQRKEADA